MNPQPGTEATQAYDDYLRRQFDDPEFALIYAEESEKKALWLELADARHAAGLTQAQLAARLGVSQAQVARIEKRGYDAYTLTSLRRYVAALGDGYSIEIHVRRNGQAIGASAPASP